MASLPPLVTLADFGTWVGEDLTGDQQAAMILDAASALVRAEARRTWTDDSGTLVDVPEQVRTITLEVAARRWRNPEGYTSETDGDYTYRMDDAQASLYLTDIEREMLAAYRRPRAGLWTLPTTRGTPPRGGYWSVLD